MLIASVGKNKEKAWFYRNFVVLYLKRILKNGWLNKNRSCIETSKEISVRNGFSCWIRTEAVLKHFKTIKCP